MEQMTRTHYELGVEAFKSGKIDSAIQELEAATSQEPANSKAFIYLGAAYAAISRYNAAIGAFRAAEKIDPAAANIHYNIGQAYEAAGIPEEAVFEYEEALRLDPKYEKAGTALLALSQKLNGAAN